MRRNPYKYIVQAGTLTIHPPYQYEESVEADQIKENDLHNTNIFLDKFIYWLTCPANFINRLSIG